MCIVKEPKKKESNYKCTRREESRSQEGNLEKRATVVALRRQGRLRSISDQKSPRFSRVNKFLFQIGTKYSQNIFISRKYICIASKERAKESCPKYLNSCVDTIQPSCVMQQVRAQIQNVPHGPASTPPPPSFRTQSSCKLSPREAECQRSRNKGIEKNVTGNWQNISTCT